MNILRKRIREFPSENFTSDSVKVKEILDKALNGEEVDVNLAYFDHDKKRLHIKMEMIGKNTNKISASMEWISLYIDLDKRKVTEFEDEKIKLMDDFIRENKSNFSAEGLLFSSKLKK